MTFDHKLNWNSHLKNLKISANNSMKIMKTLSHQSCGSEKNSLITIYKIMILAKLEYSEVLYNTAKNQILNILNPIHNQGIRLATGAFRTSPTASIMCNAGELPLEFRRIKETLKFVTKFSNNKTQIPIRRPLNIRNSPNIPRTIHDTYKNIADTTKFKPITFNKIIFPSSPSWMWNIKLNTQLLEFSKKISSTSTIRNNFLEIIEEKYPHYIKIFTDTSKSPNGTGFAFIEYNKTSMFTPLHETSIFSAESQAESQAIQNAMTLVSEEILIISDSFSALLAFENPYPKNEIIQSIQEKLSNSRKKIEFLLVPLSHWH